MALNGTERTAISFRNTRAHVCEQRSYSLARMNRIVFWCQPFIFTIVSYTPYCERIFNRLTVSVSFTPISIDYFRANVQGIRRTCRDGDNSGGTANRSSFSTARLRAPLSREEASEIRRQTERIRERRVRNPKRQHFGGSQDQRWRGDAAARR